MAQTVEERNKALVLKAFNTLFNQRDYASAERFWSPNYIQHSAHIEPGREGLFNLIKSLPATLKYEAGVIVAEGNFVIVHGRFSGDGRPRNWKREHSVPRCGPPRTGCRLRHLIGVAARSQHIVSGFRRGTARRCTSAICASDRFAGITVCA